MSRSNLLKHIRIHTKERQYRCHICGKNFTDRSNLLLRHLPLHQDDLVTCFPFVQSSSPQCHLHSMHVSTENGTWTHPDSPSARD
mmetsp:Transcript_8792/g.17228  ORF Transcript_8792/g.17228 Transcript_8792/m.17228 type:complete len:85 (+) Transcript_8792:80-334(+)